MGVHSLFVSGDCEGDCGTPQPPNSLGPPNSLSPLSHSGPQAEQPSRCAGACLPSSGCSAPSPQQGRGEACAEQPGAGTLRGAEIHSRGKRHGL